MMYKFKPLLKQTMWGGKKIIAFKHLDLHMEHVGESWEVSGIKGCESVVDSGPDDGKGLNQLLHEQKGRLLGKENYERFGDEFPLLIKFIDVHQNLSIQVHPDEETARRHGKGRGKSEMWYVLKSASGAQVFNGLRQHITPEEYKQMVEDGTITNALAHYTVHEGDVFFIPAGRIHSIGAGCFVAEIQTTSDVTYRIYDFNRRDKDGNLRQLHTRAAAESIDYTVLADYRTHYTAEKNRPLQLISCPHFTTAVYDLDESMTLDYSDLDSFVIIMALEGEATLTIPTHDACTIRAGQTVLIPACVSEVKVEGNVKFLETFV